ncbi:transglutaminase-like cysteine proteinase BTLCP [Desulfonatronum thiosulfatophilum]|uniref:Transglutaminase-like cysteine proteinase BTLCP n=2 Tax=Desulfonatronum thiosulfatophilum TaxID=617002 RepID=A0A1G6DK98_9BACT|nr:transglutaminase-like cysteine proteinase BTLCP [Desulfonatronum thiosulfatophilum]
MIRHYYRAWLLTALIVTMVFASVSAGEDFRINRDYLEQAEIKYGEGAVLRLLEWEEMIRTTDRNKTDLKKLEKVNQFFNTRIMYATDIEIWGVEDYWATPFEFLSRNAGDCEDFAIAKYFTLKAIGVKEERLNILYVKALQYGIAHMVLAYYETPEAEPLILDNYMDSILLASKRRDILPVFGFNASGLWSSRQRAQGNLSGRSDRLRPWQDLQAKMHKDW